MNRRSVALFLSTLALVGTTTACGRGDEAGEQGGDEHDGQQIHTPSQASPAKPPAKGDDEGGEGGEGGEG